MRAAVLEAAGEPMVVEELDLDPPGPGEVRVRLDAAGVCHSDLHRARGDWGEPQVMVLGHEAAGVVMDVGQGVESPAPGQKVILCWHYPCLECKQCLAGQQWLCSKTKAIEHLQTDGTTRLHRRDGSDVLAYLTVGAFGECTVVPAQAAIPVDDSIPGEVACLVGCCVSTGVGAVVNTARVPAGASVAVVGLGGVGLSAIMGAKLAGADVIVAVDRVESKLALASELGATATVLAGDRDVRRAIRAATEGGADFVFEAIGLPDTIETAVGSLARGGTAVLVGLTPLGARPSFDSFSFVDKGQRVIGSIYGSCVAAVDFPRFADLYRAGSLPLDRLIDRRIGLDDVEEALKALARGEGLRRIIVY